VELRFKISSGSSTNGVYEVYVDGVQVMIDETARTNGNFFTVVEFVQFNNMSGASTTDGDYVGYDDIYILEVDGTAPEDFIGHRVRVVSLPPDGDDTTQWSTSSGTVHYTLIDENGADDTDYIIHGVNTQRDLFTCTNVVQDGEIFSVKVEAEALAVGETTHTLDVELKSNTTTVQTNHAVDDLSNYKVFAHYADVERLDSLKDGKLWAQS
jgi:hypothetical protein